VVAAREADERKQKVWTREVQPHCDTLSRGCRCREADRENDEPQSTHHISLPVQYKYPTSSRAKIQKAAARPRRRDRRVRASRLARTVTPVRVRIHRHSRHPLGLSRRGGRGGEGRVTRRARSSGPAATIDGMNERGTPETLVASHPGNTNSLRHGV